MSQSIFEAPPISGDEQVPFQDLEMQSEMYSDSSPTQTVAQAKVVPQQQPVAGDTKNKSIKIYLIGLSLAVGLMFILLLAVLVVLLRRSDHPISSQPTPAPQSQTNSEESSIPGVLKERVQTLEKDVNGVDLQELNLSFPQVDWEIRF